MGSICRPEISCENCGSVTPGALQSCSHRSRGECPYALEQRSTPPARLPGIPLAAMGILFLAGIGALPFLIRSGKPPGVYELLVNFVMLTFGLTVSNVFLVFGLVMAALRRSLFHNHGRERYIEVFSLFGLKLACRVIDLGKPVLIQVRVAPLPLSLAGFLMRSPLPAFMEPPSFKLPPGKSSEALARLIETNAQLDRGVVYAMLGAIADLLAHSCIVIRSARQETFPRWLASPSTNTFYLCVGSGQSSDLGLLEADLLEKIRNWGRQQWKAADMIAPTFADLVMTYQDSDGDFSAYQIRKLLLRDGESRNVLKTTGQGFLGRLLPKIEPSADAAGKIGDAQKIIEEAVRLFHEQGGLEDHIIRALDKAIHRKSDKIPASLDEQNAVLRKKLFLYLIGISFALALVLTCIAYS